MQSMTSAAGLSLDYFCARLAKRVVLETGKYLPSALGSSSLETITNKIRKIASARDYCQGVFVWLPP